MLDFEDGWSTQLSQIKQAIVGVADKIAQVQAPGAPGEQQSSSSSVLRKIRLEFGHCDVRQAMDHQANSMFLPTDDQAYASRTHILVLLVYSIQLYTCTSAKTAELESAPAANTHGGR